MGIVEVEVSVLVTSLILCCSPDAMILILSGSHGTEEGKEGRIVDGGMMIGSHCRSLSSNRQESRQEFSSETRKTTTF